MAQPGKHSSRVTFNRLEILVHLLIINTKVLLQLRKFAVGQQIHRTTFRTLSNKNAEQISIMSEIESNMLCSSHNELMALYCIDVQYSNQLATVNNTHYKPALYTRFLTRKEIIWQFFISMYIDEHITSDFVHLLKSYR